MHKKHQIDLTDEEFFLLKDYMHRCCGLDISIEKKYLFKTRLSDLLREEKIDSFKDLHAALIADGNRDLNRRMIEYMTTNETSFFRDTHPFEALMNIILPRIEETKRKENLFMPSPLRIWSAGCSTGQEAYSIAMTVLDWLPSQTLYTQEKVFILASDISKGVLEKAREGVYDAATVPPPVMENYGKRYLLQTGKSVKVNEPVKKLVSFEELNLSSDFSDRFAYFDIIFCRNVIIYFSIESKKQILSRFHKLLSPSGILILGASENLYTISNQFEAEHHGAATFYRTIA
ncbi:MAG: protein-glutamate O-methyltransferase CheR [Spirochaetales bacterium]|nr:protein-glutamate O-methyltransferase CheR [Spirochaetales bacterium]